MRLHDIRAEDVGSIVVCPCKKCDKLEERGHTRPFKIERLHSPWNFSDSKGCKMSLGYMFHEFKVLEAPEKDSESFDIDL